MRDELSELRRNLWMLHRRLQEQIKVLDGRIFAAYVICNNAADHEIEQVYNAQHALHSDRAARLALVSACTELADALGAKPGPGGSASPARAHPK